MLDYQRLINAFSSKYKEERISQQVGNNHKPSYLNTLSYNYIHWRKNEGIIWLGPP